MKAAKGVCSLDFCMWMREKFQKNEFEIFATHAWAIWKERQNFLHEQEKNQIVKSITWSTNFLSEFQRARRADILNSVAPKPKLERNWKPPDRYRLKLNVDACVNELANRFSVGGILHNTQRRLLLAFGKHINQPISVIHGELLAIWEGVKLLYDHNHMNVQIESDSLLAVQAVTTSTEDLGYTGICAAEVNKLMQGPVISNLSHVSRSANSIAHNVASFASSSPSSFVWMNGEFPSWLVKLVTDDIS